MGSCVSVHKSRESARWSYRSHNGNRLIPPPVQKLDSLDGGDRTLAEFAIEPQFPPSRFRDAGSKGETFFDSHGWLESDCEDDFLSINGDFIPSGGSTPIHHHNSSSRNLSVSEKVNLPVPQQSPPDKMKRLSELFKESSRNHLYIDDEMAASSKENVAPAAAESTTSSPLPQSSSETTPPPPLNKGVVRAVDKSGKYAQCCLPRMLSSRSFSERKKKASPARSRIS